MRILAGGFQPRGGAIEPPMEHRRFLGMQAVDSFHVTFLTIRHRLCV